MDNKILKTVRFLKHRVKFSPEVLIILGSGFSRASDIIYQQLALRYEDIPYFHKTTVQTHKGRLIFGKISGRPVMVMEGRLHSYEGLSLQEVVYPVRVAAKLGAREIITTNLAGGINKNFRVGDFMVIKDHINLSCDNPLIGYKAPRERFVDMFDAYSPKLISLAKKAARRVQIRLRQGVLIYLTGPNFETLAELKFLKAIGADVVGWSVVPEVLAARQENMEVLGISCISDISWPDRYSKVNIDKIFQVGLDRAQDLARLIRAYLELSKKKF